MNEAQWLSSEDPAAMLTWLGAAKYPPSSRKLRLFACACCREVPGLLAGKVPYEESNGPMEGPNWWWASEKSEAMRVSPENKLPAWMFRFVRDSEDEEAEHWLIYASPEDAIHALHAAACRFARDACGVGTPPVG